MYVDRERVRARAKRHNRVFILIFGWLFAFLGFGLMCGGVWMTLEGVEFRKGADTTKAIILAMRGKTRESLGMPHVRYNVAGKTYEATLTSSSGGMRTGQVVDVQYARNTRKMCALLAVMASFREFCSSWGLSLVAWAHSSL